MSLLSLSLWLKSIKCVKNKHLNQRQSINHMKLFFHSLTDEYLSHINELECLKHILLLFNAQAYKLTGILSIQKKIFYKMLICKSDHKMQESNFAIIHHLNITAHYKIYKIFQKLENKFFCVTIIITVHHPSMYFLRLHINQSYIFADETLQHFSSNFRYDARHILNSKTLVPHVQYFINNRQNCKYIC